MHGGELPTETRKNHSLLWSYKLQVVGYGEPNEFPFSGRARNALNYEVIFQASPFIFLRFCFQECVSVYISMRVIMAYARGVYTHAWIHIPLTFAKARGRSISLYSWSYIFEAGSLSHWTWRSAASKLQRLTGHQLLLLLDYGNTHGHARLSSFSHGCKDLSSGSRACAGRALVHWASFITLAGICYCISCTKIKHHFLQGPQRSTSDFSIYFTREQ